MSYRIWRISSAFSILALGLAACGDDQGSGNGGATTSGGAPMTTSDGDGASAVDTGPGDATIDPGNETTDDGASASSGADGAMPLPDGAMCTEGAMCQSMECFAVPVYGGICGECDADADCPDGGCSYPNPIVMPPLPSACNMGELGAGCEASEVCARGSSCEVILDVPGILTARTCSECSTDEDCADGGQLCAPTYDVEAFSGYWNCVDPMSIPNGEGCAVDGSGDEQCSSGACAVATVMGFVELGMCSDCDDDADCENGQVCNPPSVDVMTFEVVPGACGDP